MKDELIILGFQRASEEQRQQIKERRAASIAREHTKVTMEMTEKMKAKMEEKDKGTVAHSFLKAVYNIILTTTEQAFDRLQKWLAPPTFMQEFEQAQEMRMEGTALWLYRNPTFSEWRLSRNPTDPYSNVLWTQGKKDKPPGSYDTVVY